MILVRVKTIEIQAAALAPSKSVHSYANEDDTKGWATDREETNAARVKRPTKVIESKNPTFVKFSSINFVRHEGAYRAQRTSLPENGRTYVEIVKGLLEEKNTVLPLRPETHKVRNPKAQKSGPVTHKAMSTKEIERGSREERDTRVVAVSGTKKRIRLRAITEEKGAMRNTEWKNTVGERKEVAAKRKLESLIRKPVPIKKNSVKGDNSARGGVTKSLKRLSTKLLGIYQFNPSRYKSIFLRRKKAYSESFRCKRKQVN